MIRRVRRAAPRDVDIAPDGSVAYVPSGDVAGVDAIYVIDLTSLMIVDTVALGGVNPNSLAVAPDGQTGAIFSDAFESDDTSAW